MNSSSLRGDFLYDGWLLNPSITVSTLQRVMCKYLLQRCMLITVQPERTFPVL